MSRYNAQETAEEAVAEAIRRLNTLRDYDSADIAEEAGEGVPEVIYYSDMPQIIQDYESEYGRDAEDLTNGIEYIAADWQQAQAAYAGAIWYCAVTAQIGGAVTEAAAQMELFEEEVALLGGNPADARFTSDCEYGWEAHNYETAEGVMVWGAKNPHGTFNYNPELLEGELLAVSFKLMDGLWLNLAWTPKEEQE